MVLPTYKEEMSTGHISTVYFATTISFLCIRDWEFWVRYFGDREGREIFLLLVWGLDFGFIIWVVAK